MLSIAWLGDLFLDALKMMIIPLIIAAIISGVTSLGDIRKLGKIGNHEGCLRVTIGTKEMNSKFLLAVRDYLG